jgi:glycerophosphoryl diester phosphodiesterase
MRGADSNRPLLLGHRGTRGRKIPENSFAAFDQALLDGCDGFEFDVRLTADGKGVVCHDPHSEAIEIASAAAADCAGLPKLEEVLARYYERAFLDIELKVFGLESGTVRSLRRKRPGHGFVVSSFLPEVLQRMHSEDSTLPLGLICESHAELLRWTQLPIEYAIPHHTLVAEKLIQELKAAGRKILVWTVNSPAQMQRLRDWGVDGIISDDTRLLVKTLG